MYQEKIIFVHSYMLLFPVGHNQGTRGNRPTDNLDSSLPCIGDLVICCVLLYDIDISTTYKHIYTLCVYTCSDIDDK
jgi:hypothetical protein